MKQIGILWLALIAVLALALPVQAQIGSPATPVSAVAVTNADGSASATGNVAQVNLAGSSAISVQLILSNKAANTSNTIVWIEKSLDQANWVNFATMLRANAGTVTTSCISNFTAAADGYWRISITNGCDTAAGTNYVTIKVNKKPGL